MPAKPFYTNGLWDATKQELTWQTALPGSAGTPYLTYATWALPDDAGQKQRFGRVLLRDQALADYVLWLHSLGKEEAAEWEVFSGNLRPGAALAAHLAGFRFKSEADAGPATEAALASSRAHPARELLRRALQE